jgi:hypothetical protein
MKSALVSLTLNLQVNRNFGPIVLVLNPNGIVCLALPPTDKKLYVVFIVKEKKEDYLVGSVP